MSGGMMARGAAKRHGAWWTAGVAMVALLGALLAGCATYHGPVTVLGPVDQYPVGRWTPYVATNHVTLDNGIYLLPKYHLILVHLYSDDESITTLGPGALHGAVGVWWVGLDDRAPAEPGAHAGALRWDPCRLHFTADASGAEYDLAGDYLAGPAPASLSRYPLSINPEDASLRVALSRADEITVPRPNAAQGRPAYLAPAAGSCG
ncbi:MAG TPA: hypothetical protein VGR57_03440 [Ktedonobacterales bacterium]|nr:hypothetical protein [Ktedonobacterales bacterium]